MRADKAREWVAAMRLCFKYESARGACTASWRRYSTVISFEASDMKEQHVIVDADYVRNTLTDVVKDQDLTRNIL